MNLFKNGNLIIIEKNGNEYIISNGNQTIPPEDIPVSSVAINNKITQLTQNLTHQLGVSVIPSNATNKTLTYTSSNTSIATVSSSGLITAKGVGSCTITVRSVNNVTDEITLSVIENTSSGFLIINKENQYLSDGLFDNFTIKLNEQPTENKIVRLKPLDDNLTLYCATRWDSVGKKLTDANGNQVGASLPAGCTAPGGNVIDENNNSIVVFTPNTYNIEQNIKASTNVNVDRDDVVATSELVMDNEKADISYVIKNIDNENVADGMYYGFKIPYISFYYFNPKPMYNEDFVIPFYVSDYYQKEWLQNDNSIKFNIECCVYNMDTTLYKKVDLSNINAGDNTINLGQLEPSEYYLTIQAIQPDSGFVRKSQLLTTRIWVIDESYTITPAQIYTITQADLDRHNIKNNNSKLDADMDNTRTGLSALWNEIKANGYRKCIMLPGTYRVAMDYSNLDEYHIITVNGLKLPTNFTVDLNDAVLKLDQKNGVKTNTDGTTSNINTALLLNAYNTVDSHVENGILEGDWFDRQANSLPYGTQAENRQIFRFTGGRFNSFKNILLRQATGHALGSVIGFGYGSIISGTGELWTNSKIVNGVEVPSKQYSSYRFTDISKCTLLGFGRYLGYRAIRGGTDTHVLIHFYDINKNFIKTIPAMQYRHVFVPVGAHYARATVAGDLIAENDVNSCFINHCLGEHNEIVNCQFEDCNTTALANSASAGTLIDNCTFTRCGYRITACPVDFEDGWQECQDIFLRNCTELEHVGTAVIIDNSGYNHVYENSNMAVTARYSCYGEVVRENYTGGFSMEMGKRAGSAHSRLQGFNIPDKFSGTITALSPRDAYLESGSSMFSCVKNSTLSGFNNSLELNWFENCIFHKLSSYNRLDIRKSTIYGAQQYFSCNYMKISDSDMYGYNSETSITFPFNNATAKRYFERCNFKVDTTFNSNNNYHHSIVTDCVFEKTMKVRPNLANTKDDVVFENCTFKGLVTTEIRVTNCYVKFVNCTFEAGKTTLGSFGANIEYIDCIG